MNMAPSRNKQHHANRRKGWRWGLVGFGFITQQGLAEVALSPGELANLDLEQLMELEITSVAKHRQRLGDAAAAVTVITREDIRRSGLTTLPEVLRQVPGLHVARINGNRWAIGSRGLNGMYAGSLLVLVDGRSVYTPLYGGVYWDAQDLMLDEVERIEVIRGPGGALWGSNAVNGVINVITRHSRETQGERLTLGAGSGEAFAAEARHGGQAGDNLTYRLTLKAFDREEASLTSGEQADDRWRAQRAGLRVDWRPSSRDEVMITGGAFDNKSSNLQYSILATSPFSEWAQSEDNSVGQYMFLQWRRQLDTDSDLTVKGYYDGSHWESVNLVEDRETLDLEFQHHMQDDNRHEITWGLGYRASWDRYEESLTLSMEPDAELSHLVNLFVQDEIPLAGEALKLTLGGKLEHNDDTGWELQPNVRLSWRVAADHTLWTAVSRAVLLPNRAITDMTIHVSTFPFDFNLAGNDQLDAVTMIAYEAGYRGLVTRDLTLAVSLFVHDYQDLFGTEATAATGATATLVNANLMAGYTSGLEVEGVWEVSRSWRLKAGYAFLDSRLKMDDGSPVTSWDPRHQAQLISTWNPGGPWELDAAWYFVDRLPALEVPAYHRLDVRLGWKPNDTMEASLAFQNLLDDSHLEYVASDMGVWQQEVPRAVVGRLTWSW